MDSGDLLSALRTHDDERMRIEPCRIVAVCNQVFLARKDRAIARNDSAKARREFFHRREEFARSARTSFQMMKFATVLALAAALLAAPALAVPTVVAHTSVVVFNAKSMHATTRLTGNCWTTSIASKRSDAYRCMTGNAIHDPCFKVSGSSVACPVDLTANSGVIIKLTKPLPREAGVSNAWQMRLTSGALCNVGTGTTVPGYPFYCTGNVVCAAPPEGEPHGAVFVHCATLSNGKPQPTGTTLVTTLYE